jgi:PilZ domain/SPOR domain
MSLPVMKPERRRPPRVKPEGLAYINIEPDNGGIVLNISDGGLCFHSVAPVQASKVIRFWFSAEGNRIDADGRLAWLDEKRKTGGVQFQSLSAEAHQKIRTWMGQTTESLAPERKPATVVRAATVTQVRVNPAKNALSAVATVVPAAQKALPQWFKAAMRKGEFYRGLATGLLIGLVVTGGILFRSHRRQLGEFLIHMGQRFAPASQAQVPSSIAKSVPAVVPAAPAPSRQPTTAPASLPKSASAAQGFASRSPIKEVTASRPAAKKEEPSQPAPVPLPPQKETIESAALVANSSVIPTGGTTTQPQLASQPTDMLKDLIKPSLDALPNSVDVAEVNSGVPLGKYFEVGKFKDELQAQETTEDLAHFGFPATVIPKNLLWLNSYQVLAGPFNNKDAAQVARRNLQTKGFTPHSLPKRSRQVTFSAPTAALGAADVLIGEFVVSWESYDSDATVRFVKDGSTMATGQGKWVKRATRYPQDGVAYQRNQNGSRTLVEIWFHGMTQDVVLSSSRDNSSLVF